MKNLKKYLKGFTLVELIIVITILAILATIAFVSFQNYTKDARDSSRMTTFSNLNNGFEIFFTKVGNYPQPDSSVAYTGGNTTIQMGIVGENVSKLIGINTIPKDPLTNQNYVYSLGGNGYYYQIAGEKENTQASIFTSVYAAGENKLPIVKGNYKMDPSLPSLIPIKTSITGSGIFDPNVCFIVDGGSNNFSSTSSNCIKKKDMELKKFDSSLVGYWDMETLCNSINCGNVSNSGYVKNLVTSDISILSGTVLKNHNNADYLTKTFTGNAILGNGSAYIIDFTGGLQTSSNIVNIEKENSFVILLNPIFSTNFDGSFGNIWNRNFLYDYRYQSLDTFRSAILMSDLGIYSYRFVNGLSSSTRGTSNFNFIKNQKYIITSIQSYEEKGGKTALFTQLYINGNLIGKKYQSMPLPNISSTGSIFHIGTAKDFDMCGTSVYPVFENLEKGCPINGIIDDIKIYNRALTDEEIVQQAKIAGF